MPHFSGLPFEKLSDVYIEINFLTSDSSSLTSQFKYAGLLHRKAALMAISLS
jgi:hypothetical protein